MSIKHILNAFNAKVGNSTRKLILIKLADNANDNGECWPSYQYIADQCEVSDRCVHAHIAKLEEMGFLRVEKRKSKTGLNRSNVYHLNLTCIAKNLRDGSEKSSLGSSEKSSPRTCHSLEPVKESKKGTASPIPYDEIANAYNELIRKPFPRISKVSPERKRLIQKFYSEVDCNMENVRGYFEMFSMHAPKWMEGGNGYNPRGFDYIVKQKTVIELRELIKEMERE